MIHKGTWDRVADYVFEHLEVTKPWAHPRLRRELYMLEGGFTGMKVLRSYDDDDALVLSLRLVEDEDRRSARSWLQCNLSVDAVFYEYTRMLVEALEHELDAGITDLLHASWRAPQDWPTRQPVMVIAHACSVHYGDSVRGAPSACRFDITPWGETR